MGETTLGVGPVEIRRNVTLNALVGTAAGALAIAYLTRATSTGGGLDWAFCIGLTVVALIQFVALMDARTPLWIADDEGVRFRLGSEWVGLPWPTISQVITEQRDLPWREGRLVVVPRNPAHVVDSLSSSAQRELRWQRRLHGAPLSVPLSLFTTTSSRQLAHDLRQLAGGRADVVGLRGRERAQLAAHETAAPRQESAEASSTEVEVLGDEVTEPRPAPRIDPVAAVRAARSVLRTEVVSDERPRIVSPAAALPVVAAESASPEPVAIIDDVQAPVVDPVIGPEIAAARTRAGLSVEQLSERTRIRPHVLEAIEADDFGPCGGDFYARGHLSTLARYLGLDIDEMHRQYDDLYATGPINARRVFEAELATGLSGGMRATLSGPRWSLLVGAALVLTMVWGVARYFTDEPEQVLNPPTSDSASLTANRKPITSPLTKTAKVSVKALQQPVKVTVTDRFDRELFVGKIAAGDRITVVGVGPFTITAGKAEQARIWLDDKALGVVGEGTAKASREVG